MGRVKQRTVVFLGPTLPVAQARTVLDATYLPPARMGDVYRAGRDGATAIGLVDGYYERVPAVWHKEILWALAQGIAVYGGGSMGALRAAELDAFGMVGVGEVYRQFRDGTLVDDDEVALLHGPAEGGYRPASVPLVDMRATLRAAVEAGVLSRADERVFVTKLRAMHYPDRTYEVLSTVDGFAEWVAEHAVSQKRLDAWELLRSMREGGAPTAPLVFEPTWIWEQLTGQV